MSEKKVVIVDYGVGNTFSVSNAIAFLGYKRLTITDDPAAILDADALILPGVGAFQEAAQNLTARGLIPVLNEAVLGCKKPILGICVGMQLMATQSEENGIHPGLNWIPGTVVKLDLPKQYSVPHVGWNNILTSGDDPVLELLEEESNFYFDHSYYMHCDDRYITGFCDYGTKVTAVVRHENIHGVQFHPEKSQVNGLKLLRGFLNSI